MAKLTLTPVTNLSSGSAVGAINTNYDRIEAAFDNVLSRDGSTPNQMNADIDMNSNDLLNVNTLYANNIIVDGSEIPSLDSIASAYEDVQASVAEAVSAAIEAENALSRVQPSFRNAFYKRIQKILPLSGGSYSSIISTFGHAFLVPQGFHVDQTAKRIYILYGADTPDTSTYVFVWSYNNWNAPNDFTYISSFRVDTTAGNFAESIVVRVESGIRYAYIRAGGNILKKYDITTLPADMGLVAPAATVLASNAYSQFAYRNGEWVVQQVSVTLGAQTRRGYFSKFNDTLSSQTGTLLLAPEDVGPWTSSAYENYFPKMQGIAIGEGYYAIQLGGKHTEGDTPVPYGYQGIKIVDCSGKVVVEAALDPERMIDVIEANGYPCTTIEGEGICIPEDGEIYTLSYYISSLSGGAPANLTQGIVIFKEFSKDEDAIDFTEAAAVFPGFDRAKFALGHFPRNPAGAINPITGAQFTTLEQICDYMVAMDVPRFEFYSTTFSILDTSAVAIPGGIYVTIQNANNATFPVTYQYATGSQIRGGVITGTAGSRTLSLSPLNRPGWASLADADATLTVGSSQTDRSFVTRTANRTITLSKTGATVGSYFVVRLNTGAFTVAFLNGAAGPTIVTGAANTTYDFVYDGTDWVLRR